MRLTTELVRSIAMAVENAGGDITDVEDLVAVWERLERDQVARVDRMRYEARTIRCCCADGAEPMSDGRCQRCYGRAEASS